MNNHDQFDRQTDRQTDRQSTRTHFAHVRGKVTNLVVERLCTRLKQF